MSAMNDTILMISRAGMEITWRYAWILFLTRLAFGRHFPLPVAVCAFLMAAVLTQLPVGRKWRVYQRLLVQITGFILFGLLTVHQIQFQALPFFSLDWMGHLLFDTKSIFLWFNLLLILLCLWIIWRGGQILVKSARLYFPICLHFDKGLGLFFLLLIAKAFVESKTDFSIQGRDTMSLAIAFFVFSLTAISVARNQGKVEKSFLSGHRGIGLILTISTLVTLLGTGTTLLTYPYLYKMADALLIITKTVAQSTDPVIFGTLLFLLRRRERSIQSDELSTDAPKLTHTDTPELADQDAQSLEGVGSLFQTMVGWSLFGIIGLVFLGTLAWILIYTFRLLLKRNSDDTAHSLSTGWILDMLRKLERIPLLIRDGWVSLLKGVDCAATAYIGMLRWGSQSGMDLVPGETPAEYGNRLMKRFPGLGIEIEMIVNAFNREVYGQTTTDQQMLFLLRSAQRRMRDIRYWPLRIKVWFSQ